MIETQMSEIHRIKCGNGNCYIVENGTSGILVDTGKREFINQVIEACKIYHIKLIVLTHAHFDHAENAVQISNILGVPIGIDVDNRHLIVSDTLMNMFYPTVSMLFHNKKDMLESAEKISKLGNRTIYFAHGKPVPNKQ